MGDSESSFPLQRLVVGPSIAMALFGRAQYNKAIKGNVYSRLLMGFNVISISRF